MTDDLFQSSDTNRHAQRLKHVQTARFDQPFDLERGGCLPGVTIAYETYGQLSPARDNAVLLCHALSGDSHVARHDDQDDPGWWDIMVGPGKPIDTDRYFVVCPNILGGCRGTTGPNSLNPATGRPYGGDFPAITVGDMVRVQCLLIDHLQIERLLAVVGGSLGGNMTLDWAVRFPDRLAGAAALATSAQLTSQALAFDVVGRNAILRDPAYHNGQYYDKPDGPRVGLALARMLAHITYLSREAMMRKFGADRLAPRDIQTEFETHFSVGSYLAYQGDRFGERFDANSYLTLTMAIDLFNLGNSPQELVDALRNATCRWLLISYTSDWLFPPFQSRNLVNALIVDDKPVSYCNVETTCGHDAFLLPNDFASYGELVRAFLRNLTSPSSQDEPVAPDDGPSAPFPNPRSIFHRQHRIDYDSIVELIPSDASVLDLGCGAGGLLSQLRRRGHRRLVGIERDERAILRCVRRGLDVVQADLNEGLAAFTDHQFDVVVLSQTLQTIIDVRRVLDEMLRVGRRAVVSFPNLGYELYRRQLADTGHAPRPDDGEGYQWHNTPNVRFLTIADFEAFCADQKITIHERIWLDTRKQERIQDDPNRNANLAILVLSR
ncbi:MAG TPA: homoserine O-acetyltransferase [Thermoguttaceae bacterium]|nr:homoserine O-acetyltransferase [Thermoguttaceae bacterium]